MEYKIIGLMSGTSLDGLDIAFVLFRKKDRTLQESDNVWHYEILHADNIPYSAEWREKLRGAYYMTAEGIVALDAEYGRYLGSPVKPCFYPQIFATLNRKNFTSVTPLSDVLNALILALNDSAEALVERLMKKFSRVGKGNFTPSLPQNRT